MSVLTLVPERLLDDLVASSVTFGEVLSSLVLLDLTIVVLGIAPMLVEGGELHGFLNGGEVDCSHWITICQSL